MLPCQNGEIIHSNDPFEFERKKESIFQITFKSYFLYNIRVYFIYQ